MIEILALISGFLLIFYSFYFTREFHTGEKDLNMLVLGMGKEEKLILIITIVLEELFYTFVYCFLSFFIPDYSTITTCLLFGLSHIPFLSMNVFKGIYIFGFFFTFLFRLLMIYLYLYSFLLPFIFHVVWDLLMFYIINKSQST